MGTMTSTHAAASALDISDDEIRRLVEHYSTLGPRYTSYPPAPQWTTAVDSQAYREVLRNFDAPAPIALYTHIPFCRRMCLYCACNVRITGKQKLVDCYVQALAREVETVAGLLGRRPQLAQMHFGGGTPTYLSPVQLAEVIDQLDAHFESIPGAERSIEVDPRVTTREHLEMLHARRFRRISVGVQDLDIDVQRAVKRQYSEQQLCEFVAEARRVGFAGVNLDLIYGLPFQTAKTWERTLDSILAIRPDRLAVFGYAHVPWKKPQQKALQAFPMPSPQERLTLAIQCRRALVKGGYLAIGLDHFALPEDELAVAFRRGTINRNFMGYTVQAADTMLAFGASAIGDFPAAYVHNQANTDEYVRLIGQQGLAVALGHRMTDEDRLRRRIIVRLMSDFRISPAAIEREFGIVFGEHFAPEIEQLHRFVDRGILYRDDSGWHATLAGTFVIRNVAMIFDRYLEADRGAQKRYSTTI
jgi:oxygen-independent coproporphyrinogen-3 oxidase